MRAGPASGIYEITVAGAERARAALASQRAVPARGAWRPSSSAPSPQAESPQVPRVPSEYVTRPCTPGPRADSALAAASAA